MPTVTNRGMEGPLTKKYMREENREDFTPIVNGRSMRPPLRTLYIHSVAKRAFTLRHLPLFPKLELRACDPDINNGRWITCTAIPDPIVQISADNERGGNRLDDNDAWPCLIDALSPGNYTMDPYLGSANPDFYADRRGTNLICKGVFPSVNEIPTEAEIRRAEECREKRDRWLTQSAMKLAAKSTRDLNEFLDLHPDTHTAMDSLGLSAPWHQENAVKVYCPNCGDVIRAGLGFHKSSADILCVIDPVKAFKAGAISRERFEELQGEVVPEKPRRGPGRRAAVEDEV